MPYLLDTNICIYLIKNRPVHVIEEFQKHSLREMAVSIITVFGLEYGAEKSQFKQRSENALANFLLPMRLIELGLFFRKRRSNHSRST